MFFIRQYELEDPALINRVHYYIASDKKSSEKQSDTPINPAPSKATNGQKRIVHTICARGLVGITDLV
jgi:hypothetical protein